MRVFYDTEFFQNHLTHSVTLISIGMVREDDEPYYAINHRAPWASIVADDWLRENVLCHLPGRLTKTEDPEGVFDPTHFFLPNGVDLDYKHPDEIAAEVREFTKAGLKPGEQCELWGYYADYDHVLISQLFGAMTDLPDHVPMFTHDLMQEMQRKGIKRSALPPDSADHHALHDARWVKAAAKIVLGS